MNHLLHSVALIRMELSHAMTKHVAPLPLRCGCAPAPNARLARFAKRYRAGFPCSATEAAGFILYTAIAKWVSHSATETARLIRVYLCLALFLSCAASRLRADELQKAGDMESPKVTGKQALIEGGDPTNGGAGPGWTAMSGKGRDGVEAGMTDTLAHGGKQALYITFTNATKPFIGAVLTAEPVPVSPGETYTVSAWGRLDEANPVTGMAVAKAEVAFLEADGVSVAETRYIGKSLSSDSGKVFFDSGDWQELKGNVKAPENAASVRVRWIFQKETDDDSPVSGIAYFDDFSLASR